MAVGGGWLLAAVVLLGIAMVAGDSIASSSSRVRRDEIRPPRPDGSGRSLTAASQNQSHPTQPCLASPFLSSLSLSRFVSVSLCFSALVFSHVFQS